MYGIGELIMTIVMFLVAAIVVLPWLIILAVPTFVLFVLPFILTFRWALIPLAQALGYISRHRTEAWSKSKRLQKYVIFDSGKIINYNRNDL